MNSRLRVTGSLLQIFPAQNNFNQRHLFHSPECLGSDFMVALCSLLHALSPLYSVPLIFSCQSSSIQ